MRILKVMKERKRAVNNIYWLVKLKCWQIGQNNCIDFLVLTFYMTIEKFTDAARRNCSCLHLVLADISRDTAEISRFRLVLSILLSTVSIFVFAGISSWTAVVPPSPWAATTRTTATPPSTLLVAIITVFLNIIFISKQLLTITWPSFWRNLLKRNRNR